MSYDVECEIVINRPPHVVWRWAAEDPTLEQQWRNLNGQGVTELEKLGYDQVGVGTRFRGRVKVGSGRPQGYLNEVTALEADRLVTWETVEADGALGGRGNYRLIPLDDGTRTQFRLELDYPPRTLLGKLQRPVARVVGKRMVSKMLAKLKRLVEEAPSSPNE